MEKKEYKKENLGVISLRIDVIFISLYAIMMCVPYFISYHFGLVCAVGMVVLAISMQSARVRRSKIVLLSVAFLAICFAYKIIGVSTASWGNYGNYFLTFVSICCGIYIWYELNPKYFTFKHNHITFLFIVTVLCIITSSINSIIISSKDSNALFYPEEYANLGSTTFMYCSFLLSIVLLWIIVNSIWEYSMPRLWIVIAWVITVIYLFVYAGSSTIIISYFLFVLFVIFANSKHKMIIVPVLSIMLVFIWTFYSISIMNVLINFLEIFSPEKVTERFIAIKELLEGDNSTENMNLIVRLQLIRLDVLSWLSGLDTFIFGVGYHLSEVTNALQFFDINGSGNHSGLFDIIARYGLIGLTLISAIIYIFYKDMKLYFVNRENGIYIFNLLFIITVLNNIFNDIMKPNIIFALFFIMPLFANYENLSNKKTINSREDNH